MANTQARLRRGKQRIEWRLAGSREDRGGPMLWGAGIRVELANKLRAIGTGGIGLVHQLARQVGLVEAIDRRVQLLKVHRPYHESDHVLNLAYNALCEGTRLEDIELRRNDEVFLDALGSERIPDPTTAGDFCRRFTEMDIRRLMGAIDEARQNVWARQPRANGRTPRRSTGTGRCETTNSTRSPPTRRRCFLGSGCSAHVAITILTSAGGRRIISVWRASLRGWGARVSASRRPTSLRPASPPERRIR